MCPAESFETLDDSPPSIQFFTLPNNPGPTGMGTVAAAGVVLGLGAGAAGVVAAAGLGAAGVVAAAGLGAGAAGPVPLDPELRRRRRRGRRGAANRGGGEGGRAGGSGSKAGLIRGVSRRVGA